MFLEKLFLIKSQTLSFQGSFKDGMFPIRQGTVEASHCYDHDDSDSLFENEHDHDIPRPRLPLLGQYPKVLFVDHRKTLTFKSTKSRTVDCLMLV
jgi:hypothetical protein